MFQLTEEEFRLFRGEVTNCDLTQKATVDDTFHMFLQSRGVAMLSGVLKSKCAVDVNIQIMRTFCQNAPMGNRK